MQSSNTNRQSASHENNRIPEASRDVKTQPEARFTQSREWEPLLLTDERYDNLPCTD
ncbi:MAG TPA: hypothetical protein VF407_07200 [Polyangiaceae bacterium]